MALRVRRETTRWDPLPPTLNVSRLTFHGFIDLSSHLLQGRFKFQPFDLQSRLIYLTRHPDGSPPVIQTARPRVRNHEAIPTRKVFFFEQPKVNGIIGRPEARAN